VHPFHQALSGSVKVATITAMGQVRGPTIRAGNSQLSIKPTLNQFSHLNAIHV
jgi:hypothetical protein